MMLIAWRSVGAICERVAAEAGRDADLLAGLRRIGIDEISHRKGQRYLTVVVDHDSGRLVWAAPGRDKATVEAFFDALGSKRAKRLKLVSCDMAGWIEAVLAKRCPQAKRCVDPFHVVALATEALDRVRREVWNARRAARARPMRPRELKGARFCLLEEPREPDSAPAVKARRHRAGKPAPVPGLPAEGAAAPDLPARAAGGDPPAG